jgi:hypothetical protein
MGPHREVQRGHGDRLVSLSHCPRFVAAVCSNKMQREREGLRGNVRLILVLGEERRVHDVVLCEANQGRGIRIGW